MKRMLRTAALVTLHGGLKAKDNNNTIRIRFYLFIHYIITIYISVSTPRFDRIRFLRLGILNDLYAGKVYLWLPKTSTYILYEPEIMQRKLCNTNALAHACLLTILNRVLHLQIHSSLTMDFVISSKYLFRCIILVLLSCMNFACKIRILF